MTTLFQTTDIYSAQEARRRLAGQIRQLPYKITPVGMPLPVLRFEFLIEPIDVLTWLHNQKVPRKVYWSSRSEKAEKGTAPFFEVGGIGIADILAGAGSIDHNEVFTAMRQRLCADNPYLRYYGGTAFQGRSQREDWKGFGGYQFIIPRFEILRTEKQSLFAFNIVMKDINKEATQGILKDLDSIDFSAGTAYRTPPKIQTRQDFPDKNGWDLMFREIADKTGKLNCEKIVLARQSVFRFDKYIDPIALLKHLKDRTQNCFHFCFQAGQTLAFLGATPERLYLRENEHVKTEALAGTTPRGKNEDEDAVLEKGLLACAKNAREHRFVVDDIAQRMKKVCVFLRSDGNTRLVKLRVGQHLVTKLEGVLRQGIGDEEILRTLHPTPAVGGCPRDEALAAIARLEPFDRGWYAGPIGWVGLDSAEFAVAIRSALVNHDTLSLYAGAGIVEGSTAQGEWDEIETKIGNFMDVFNKT